MLFPCTFCIVDDNGFYENLLIDKIVNPAIQIKPI